tara:strand:- start:202 stop:351 length:150 start_codon:yes stop_codon:yes gene_type:complete
MNEFDAFDGGPIIDDPTNRGIGTESSDEGFHDHWFGDADVADTYRLPAR